jgi:hypothetical protein
MNGLYNRTPAISPVKQRNSFGRWPNRRSDDTLRGQVTIVPELLVMRADRELFGKND